MLDHMKYDAVALRARYVEQHGTDLGQIVFDAAVHRRRLEDARTAELTAEVAAINSQISELSNAAGEKRVKSQARLAVAFAAYLAMCDEDAAADSLAQAQIAPLTARSMQVQQQLRTLVQPRLSERELQDIAIYNSSSAEMLRRQSPRAHNA